MRGKVAKQLRKAAERITAKLPDRRLIWVARGKPRTGQRPEMLMHRDCTRAVYLGMKRERKKSVRRKK